METAVPVSAGRAVSPASPGLVRSGPVISGLRAGYGRPCPAAVLGERAGTGVDSGSRNLGFLFLDVRGRGHSTHSNPHFFPVAVCAPEIINNQLR